MPQRKRKRIARGLVAFLRAGLNVLAFFFDPRPAGPPWDDEWDSMPGDEFSGVDI